MNLALNLKEHHHKYKDDISSTAVSQARENDIPAYQEISEFLATFEQKKNHLLMLPAGEITENMLRKLFPKLDQETLLLKAETLIIKIQSVEQKSFRKMKSVTWIVGLLEESNGARHQACLMIGGDKETFLSVEQYSRCSN